MRPQNIERQKQIISALISASTSNGTRPAIGVKLKSFGVLAPDFHILQQLIKKGFVSSERVGGGHIRAVNTYMLTPSGIEFYEKNK